MLFESSSNSSFHTPPYVQYPNRCIVDLVLLAFSTCVLLLLLLLFVVVVRYSTLLNTIYLFIHVMFFSFRTVLASVSDDDDGVVVIFDVSMIDLFIR